MEIKKLTRLDKKLINQCDKFLVDFLEEEAVYDENFKEIKNIKSLSNDLYNEKNILLVAEENEKVLGFIFGFIEKNKRELKEIAHISFLYIAPEYRNRKIATNLIDTFIALVKNYGIEILEVKCYENNKSANRLYKKYGFNVLWSNHRKVIK